MGTTLSSRRARMEGNVLATHGKVGNQWVGASSQRDCREGLSGLPLRYGLPEYLVPWARPIRFNTGTYHGFLSVLSQDTLQSVTA